MTFDLQRSSLSGGVLVLGASGDLDAASRDEFSRTVIDALNEGHPLVLVDLGDVAFIDSAGVSAILAVHRIAESRGLPYRFLLPPGCFVLRLAEGLGVAALIPHSPTAQDAVAALNP